MTEFYIDSNAAAGGNGSLAAPWDAITDIAGLADGDTVYFARGGTYAGTWTIAKNITVDAYGSGAKPILTGSGEGGTNVCIAWTTVSTISISNLSFTTSGYGITGDGDAQNGITIEDCDFTTTVKGVQLVSGATPETKGQNVIVRRCTFTGIDQGGTAGGDIAFSRYWDDVLIEYNTAYDSVDFVVLGSGSGTNNCHRWIIRYNVSDLHTENFVDLKNYNADSWENAAQIYGNTVSRVASGYGTFNCINGTQYVIIHSNIDSGSGPMLLTQSTSAATGYVRFYNNIGYGGPAQCVLVGSTAVLPHYIDNNTFYDYGTVGDGGVYGVSINGGAGGGADKSTFRNNIIYHTAKGRTAGFSQMLYTIDETMWIIQNNIHKTWNGSADVWRAANAANNNYEDLTVAEAAARFTAGTWAGGTWEGEQFADPLLIDPANGNFRPRANSPARDAGVTISWITVDADGGSIRGAARDIGAYEAVYPAGGMGTGLGLGLN